MKTTIVFGGTSGERRVSVASAQNFATQLPDAALLFWAPDDRVIRTERDALLGFERPFERDFAPVGDAQPSLLAALDSLSKDGVVVLAVHGGSGEDGWLQAALSARGLRFTGSGAEASKRAFDKVVARNIVRAEKHLKMADALVLPQRSPSAALAALEQMFGKHGRLVVKRVADGSSVGLHHVKSREDVARVAAVVAAEPEIPYLCEQFLRGRELTCGVMDVGGPPRALPPSEVIIDEGRAFDFEGKYLGSGTREITPAELSAEQRDAVQALALDAHQALGCRGYSRTDVILTEAGAHYLETNTLPGMTKASFFPQQLAAAGISMRDFVDQLVAAAGT